LIDSLVFILHFPVHGLISYNAIGAIQLAVLLFFNPQRITLSVLEGQVSAEM